MTAAFPRGTALQDYYFRVEALELLELIWNSSLKTSLQDSDLGAVMSQRALLESSDLAEKIMTLSGPTYADLLGQMLVKLGADCFGDLRWCGAKEVWTTEFIPALLGHYPKAKAIIVRRDPRAVIASLVAISKKDPTQAGHIVSYLRHWRKDFAIATELLSRSEFIDQVSVVKYEELVENPALGSDSLCKFLGISLEPEMGNPVMGEGGAKNSNSSYGQFSGISISSLRRWPEILDEATIATIEYLCGPEMVASGYEISHNDVNIKNADVERVFRVADANSGSWRSDTGSMSEQLRFEAERWRMYVSRQLFCKEDICKNFLFQSSFFKCVEAFDSR